MDQNYDTMKGVLLRALCLNLMKAEIMCSKEEKKELKKKFPPKTSFDQMSSIFIFGVHPKNGCIQKMDHIKTKTEQRKLCTGQFFFLSLPKNGNNFKLVSFFRWNWCQISYHRTWSSLRILRPYIFTQQITVCLVGAKVYSLARIQKIDGMYFVPVERRR